MSAVVRAFVILAALVWGGPSPGPVRAADVPEPAEVSAPPVKLAVLRFESINPESKDDGKGRMVAEFMTTSLAALRMFDIVEREHVAKILDEMEFGEKGGQTASMAQKIGELLGASLVLTGSVTGYKDEVRVDARLVDVATGRVRAAQGAFSKNDLENIFNASKGVVEKIAEEVTPAIEDMVAGQGIWASPEALVVDASQKLWLQKNYSVHYSKSDKYCMQVTRGEDGFVVNVEACDKKWKPVKKVEPKKHAKVVKILY